VVEPSVEELVLLIVASIFFTDDLLAFALKVRALITCFE
jgi:hypothetical protein